MPDRECGNGEFASSLLDADRAVPRGLVAPAGGKVSRRFSVYRNNVISGLVTALGDNFPTVQRLVGTEYFRAMARIFVRKSPPASPLIFRYGAAFPAFIAEFEPARHLTFLPEVARLEWLWLESWHAADSPVLAPETLAAVAPENLAGLRFETHPATRLFSSDHAAVTIFSRDRSGADLDGLDPLQQEAGLLTRPDCDVQLRHLPKGGLTFLSALIAGSTLAQAVTMTLEEDTGFDVAAAIGAMMAAGVFTQITKE
jgi:Putative DNA-binding domain